MMNKIIQTVGSLRLLPMGKKVFVLITLALLISLPFIVTSLQERQITQSKAAGGNVYYISPAGNDANDGLSPQTAWQTISKVNSKIFLPGDQILFQGGQTFSGNLSFDAAEKGTSVNPITVSSYGTGHATLNAGSGTGISLTNTEGFVIKNLIVSGAWDALNQTGNSGSGIELLTTLPGSTKLKFFRVDNVDVGGFKNRGISVYANPSDGGKNGFEDVRITNCTVHDNGDTGIETKGKFNASSTAWAHKNIYVGYCRVYSNRGIKTKSGNTGSGIILSDVNGGTIERSVAYNNGEYNFFSGGGPYGIWTWDSNNIMIQYNESYGNKSGNNVDGGGFDLDGGATNSVMQYNYSHDNRGIGYGLFQFQQARPYYNNVVRYNISERNEAGLSMWDGKGNMKDTFIHNNTFYATNGPAFRVKTPVTNFRVFNNIFMLTSGYPILNLINKTGLTFQGNNYYKTDGFLVNWGGTTYTSLSSWRTATGQEKVNGSNVGYSIDPGLNNPGGGGTINDATQLNTLTAYQLKTTSPMKNAGINPVTVLGINPGTLDYFGNTIPQMNAYDIGAHEIPGTSTPTPAQSTNLLLNPGFELGNASWSNWNNANALQGNSHSGTYAMRAGLSAGGRGQTVNNINLANTYVLSGWGKVSTANEIGQIGIKYLNASNVKIGEQKLLFTGTSYTFKQLTLQLPAGTTSVQVYVWKNTANGGYFYADDISLAQTTGAASTATPAPATGQTATPIPPTPTKTPTPTPTPKPVNLILNPGFESVNTSWSSWGNSGAVTGNSYSGSYAMRSGTAAGGRYQQISQGAGTYKLNACGKVSKSGETGWIGVDYLNSAGTKIGSSQKFIYTGTGYSCPAMTFTAPTSTTALKVWLWKDAGNAGYFYADSLSLFKQ